MSAPIVLYFRGNVQFLLVKNKWHLSRNLDRWQEMFKKLIFLNATRNNNFKIDISCITADIWVQDCQLV
jgi:hypothetical protein